MAIVVLLGSLPYLPGFTVTDRVVLALVHLTLGVILIVGMRRASAAR